ncbi:HbrB-like-domain-containing protein [Mycena rosella]|uniref:HbrB-like-domain-containing protein n=1 Tax=Mycena rosella TaxID=1033263 RepID=A0AAD7D1S9_MYCRO|nr:HbrB-like-domain-containing protein [Mycena rosella]
MHPSDQQPSSSPPQDSPRRRSSSDSATTPRPPPAPVPRFLDQTRSPPDRRLAFITEKLAHRVDLALAQTAGMASSAAMGGSKTHTSPSKASYGRTYDSKLVSREMHRLGNLAHLPAGLAPGLSQAPSVTSLALPAPGSMAQVSLASTSSADPWGALHVHVLPLFNGEPLRIPIEDLNVLVKRHISSVVSSSLSKAIATLEHDAAELISAGMVTLNAKLSGADDDSLIKRIIDVWSFFWDQVLTYVEGVLLPLHTDPILSTLYRKPHRPTSPRQTSKGNISTSSIQLASNYIDVRTVALRSFRDKVIVPLAPRLRACIINRQENAQETPAQPRLQQMLLVLTSQSRQRPPPISLTSAPPQPSTSEAAIADLLRAVRSPRPQFDAKATATPISPARAPSFLSGGLPRDRRGRIAQKSNLIGIKVVEDGEDDNFGDETPRVAQGLTEREREREFLEALRSPDLDHTGVKGGWGLGPGGGPLEAKQEEEEDEPPMNWDEAQAVVERMVGISSVQSEMRRRP